ncbi:hypothetical protein JB92DRAFT_3017903 [Gautieria morchelliformis]|nr:hypothetical protein JB92DRAFT_3017903 [Gautieria morchelliformis]
MLNSLRHGQPDASTSARFKDLSRPIHYNDGLEPCELFPLREQVVTCIITLSAWIRARSCSTD